MMAEDFRCLVHMTENYETPPYNIVLNFFLEQRKDMQLKNFSGGENSDKVIYIISGGIAAGKSTFAYNMIKNFELKELPYVSTDVFHEFMFSEGANFNVDYEKARLFTDKILDEYLTNNVSFIWETVLSKEKKFDYLKRCQENGYRLVFFFIGIQDVNIEVNRAKKRVEEGAYDVGEEFINDRYWRSISALKIVKSMADTLAVFDNSKKMHLIYYYRSGQKYMEDILPEWFVDGING